MGFLNGLALVLLTLLGYSCGRITVAGKRNILPLPFDIIFTACLGILALFSRSYLGRWIGIPVFFSVGFLCGLLITLLTRSKIPLDKRINSDTVQNDRLWMRFRRSWKMYFAKAGNFQSRILLTWFYFIVITPFGVMVRLTSDPLHLRKNQQDSYWTVVSEPSDSLDSARRQY